MTQYTYDDQLFSDLYKEVYGSRPRYHEWHVATPARKQEIWDSLLGLHEEEMLREAERQNKAIKDFEALILNMYENGAKDRDQAIRWIVAGENDDYIDFAKDDPGYICYLFGLPYSSRYINEFARLFSPWHWNYIQGREQNAYDDTFNEPT